MGPDVCGLSLFYGSGGSLGLLEFDDGIAAAAPAVVERQLDVHQLAKVCEELLQLSPPSLRWKAANVDAAARSEGARVFWSLGHGRGLRRRLSRDG